MGSSSKYSQVTPYEPYRTGLQQADVSDTSSQLYAQQNNQFGLESQKQYHNLQSKRMNDA